MNLIRMINRCLFSILFILVVFEINGQIISEEIIFNSDSIDKFKRNLFIDNKGEVLLNYKRNEKEEYFIKNSDTIGPLRFRWSSSVKYYTDFTNENLSYYHLFYSSFLIGPVSGKDISNYRHPMSKNYEHIAIPVLSEMVLNIYFDDTIIYSMNINHPDAINTRKEYYRSDDWMTISDNGNYLGCIEGRTDYKLIHNGIITDTSVLEFNHLKVNNSGNFLYTKRIYELINNKQNYNNTLYLCTKDSVFGPFSHVSSNYLFESGAYYFNGSDSGKNFLLVNNVMYNDVEMATNIRIKDRKNYFFTYWKDNKKYVNSNGRVFMYNFEKIYFPAMDDKGNFSFYGYRNYYLYKYINGIESETPITKYGVRPIPLFITSDGHSLHYFRTDDSTYIYRDENLIFPAFSNKTNFIVRDSKEIFNSPHENDKPDEKNRLFYLEIDSSGYLVYEGKIIPTIIPLKEYSWSGHHSPGEVLTGQLTENSFYLIQNTGENTWAFYFKENTVLKLENVSYLYKNCYYNNDKEFVFFGIKNSALCKFKITL
ncbi:MAG: hypothetical protein ACOZCO_13330 [Bacteroidota bacterium]